MNLGSLGSVVGMLHSVVSSITSHRRYFEVEDLVLETRLHLKQREGVVLELDENLAGKG
jgi:hypothetical protein